MQNYFLNLFTLAVFAEYVLPALGDLASCRIDNKKYVYSSQPMTNDEAYIYCLSYNWRWRPQSEAEVERLFWYFGVPAQLGVWTDYQVNNNNVMDVNHALVTAYSVSFASNSSCSNVVPFVYYLLSNFFGRRLGYCAANTGYSAAVICESSRDLATTVLCPSVTMNTASLVSGTTALVNATAAVTLATNCSQGVLQGVTATPQAGCANVTAKYKSTAAILTVCWSCLFASFATAIASLLKFN